MVVGLFGQAESSTTVPGGNPIALAPLRDTASTMNIEHLITTWLPDDEHLNSAFSPVTRRPPLSCGVWYSPISMWSRVTVSDAGVVHDRPPAGRSDNPVLHCSHKLSATTPPTV